MKKLLLFSGIALNAYLMLQAGLVKLPNAATLREWMEDANLEYVNSTFLIDELANKEIEPRSIAAKIDATFSEFSQATKEKILKVILKNYPEEYETLQAPINKLISVFSPHHFDPIW